MTHSNTESVVTNPLKNYLSNTKFGYPFDELRNGEQEYIVQMLRTVGGLYVSAMNRADIPADFQRTLKGDHAEKHARNIANRHFQDGLEFAKVIVMEEGN